VLYGKEFQTSGVTTEKPRQDSFILVLGALAITE